MAIVKCQWEERLGDGLTKVTDEAYMIPDNICCSLCGWLMPFDNYHKAYMWKDNDCKGYITAKEYILGKLEAVEREMKIAEARGKKGSTKKDLIIL